MTPEEHLQKMKSIYGTFFTSESGQEIMKDLENFCYFKKPTFAGDALEMAYREGMRNVLLRIKFYSTKGGDE